MTDALRLDQINLKLRASSGPVHILKDVTLSVGMGTSVAITGPSGSGKSSLISVAAGLETPTGGCVTLLNEALSGRSEDELARLRRGRVSMVFQSFHLLPTMTALDNVRVPLEIAGLADATDRARAALTDVGLDSRMSHFPGELSGGERQRVAVARALASDPEIVFADEPTGNLDSKAGSEVADLLFDICSRRNATLVLVTHDHHLASRADRKMDMLDGRLV